LPGPGGPLSRPPHSCTARERCRGGSREGTCRPRRGPIVGLNHAYVDLRKVKSPEEIDWYRIGAHFSDAGMAALRDGLRPG
jgi:hypothetical protein